MHVVGARDEVAPLLVAEDLIDAPVALGAIALGVRSVHRGVEELPLHPRRGERRRREDERAEHASA